MCVRWAKSIPAFVNLDMKDQLILLEEGWRENFILSAAQFQMQFDVAPLLANAGLTPETISSDKLIKIMTEVRNFQEIISKFKQSQVDATEYACLKAITLFKTGKFFLNTFFFFLVFFKQNFYFKFFQLSKAITTAQHQIIAIIIYHHQPHLHLHPLHHHLILMIIIIIVTIVVITTIQI